MTFPNLEKKSENDKKEIKKIKSEFSKTSDSTQDISQTNDSPKPQDISQTNDSPKPQDISQTNDSPKPPESINPKTTKPISSKQSEQIIDYLLKQENAIIRPRLNFSENKITYDVLKQIGLDESDHSFLDQLCTTSKSLEKKHFQRLLICPKHKNFSITLHNCCVKCDAQNISKKYLIEHKTCGNIEEYETMQIQTQSTCSRCKRPITFTKKDCKTHGMWFFCYSCEEKFDKPKTELYCREGNHLLKMDDTLTRDVYYYTHKHFTDPTSKIILSIKNKISSHYPSENNVSVLGKSGIEHMIDIVCTINNKRYGIFLKYSDEEISHVEFHSILLQILDVPNLIPIIILIPSVNDVVKNLIKSHNVISIIGEEPEEIFDQLVKSIPT